MIKILYSAVAAALLAQSGTAKPYCEKLLDPATKVEKKFQHWIPLLSHSESGWIIAPKYLKSDLSPRQEAVNLVNEIAKQFDARGSRLAVILPPPRALFIPEQVLADLGDEGIAFDYQATLEGYKASVNTWRNAGAIALDLSDLLKIDMADEMFRRADLHWSATATALVAEQMAEVLTGQEFATPSFDVSWKPDLKISALIKDVCGFDVPDETYRHFETEVNYGLLDNAEPKIGYAGTSFSSSKNLALAAKIEHFIQQPYADFSGNGFGHAGGMLMLLNHAEAKQTHFETVIWEYPYLNSLNDIGEVRQVLGKLEATNGANLDEVGTIAFESGWASVALNKSIEKYKTLKFMPDHKDIDKLYVSYNLAGKRHKHRLVRSKKLKGEFRPTGFYFSLYGLDFSKLENFEISFPKKVTDISVGILAVPK